MITDKEARAVKAAAGLLDVMEVITIGASCKAPESASSPRSYFGFSMA